MMEHHWIIVGVGGAFALGGLMKGVIGFGQPMITLPLTAMLVDVRLALGLMTVPIVASNIRQTFRGGLAGEVMRRFWWLLIALALGFAIGAAFLARLEPDYVLAVVGLVVIVFVLTNLRPPRGALPVRLSGPLGCVAGVIAGILGALSTVFGPPLIMYLISLRLHQTLHLAAIGLLWLCGAVFLIGAYVAIDVLTWRIALLSALCVIPTLVGVAAGERLRARINPETFRLGTLAALFVIGLSLLRHAIPSS